MTLEVAQIRVVEKPWGVIDNRCWKAIDHPGKRIGEICYERPLPIGAANSGSSLLLKVITTSKPLSIQVHPDDRYAQTMGLPNGKSEAWFVIRADPGAKVAVGLEKAVTPTQLRGAIVDGSIESFVKWRSVVAGDVVTVPAGTIHTIGAGLVIAEIQQRSDATFRLFDYSSARELHVQHAMAVAEIKPAAQPVAPRRMNDQRTLLTANPHFVFERIDLPPGDDRQLNAERETWLLVIDGTAVVGSTSASLGAAFFAQTESVRIQAGTEGVAMLVAYTGNGGLIPLLLAPVATTATAQLRAGAQIHDNSILRIGMSKLATNLGVNP